MLYFIHKKQGKEPYVQANVVYSATFRAIFPDPKPIDPKMLHEMQHSLLIFAKDEANVVVSAGFIAQHPRSAESGGAGSRSACKLPSDWKVISFLDIQKINNN